ncbi:TRAP transporter substrate-binding protein [Cognatishimia activa]|uniref:Neu5Ac-binding protein n=1 Tax=Cognatishimia activa TaxID=1715691 RepID=A0A0P1IX69_9RHOB|nr:TRAP transporter substrate-binding protein [Cognatishimia activa]CUI70884.1 Neu5Ac-binding protein [Cognatishimia activa]CUK26581.1 Neu5Ac-binding protein [Cognatishimia activa]
MNIKTTMLGAVAACAMAFGVSAETLTLVNSDAIDSQMDRMNKHFKGLVEERSGGDITVNYITGTQLGTPPQVMDQMATGSVDALGTAGSWLSAYAPDTAIMTWGFTFRDSDHVFDFFRSELFQDLTTDMREKAGIRVLSGGPTEPRIVFMNDELPADGSFDGRKMRIPQIPSYLGLWSALGAQPTQVAWGEVYLGLNTGLVDGAEGPPTAAISQRFHEVAPNVYMTNHVWASSAIMINETKFQSMSAEHQEILVSAAEDAAKFAFDDASARRDEVLDQMRSTGATVRDYDTTALQAAAREGVAKAEADGLWSAGLFEKVQAQ